ncbi:MAG: RNA methyltransferase [Clostridia bacterium]|nr:RNA methyltransferase [Clostridia bacterium]
MSLLNSSRSARYDQRRFVTEGLRLCCDAMLSQVHIEKIYFTSAAYAKHSDEIDRLIAYADSACEISDTVQSRLSETKTPQGVFGLCEMKSQAFDVEQIVSGGRYIALEGIQDPSNLGAIARTAEALGIDGMVTFGCCDMYSPKALRASMGAFFRLPIFTTDDIICLTQELKSRGVNVLACVPDREACDIRGLDFSRPSLAVVGNEGNGISEELKNACSMQITVPMMGRAESLNASHAATLVMWEMMRGRYGE